MSQSSSRHLPEAQLGISAIFAALLLLPPEGILSDLIGQGILNALASLTVLIYGIAALRMMWSLERQEGLDTIPFAWTYFAIQHLAFGFGGVLVAFFDRDYSYLNEHGQFGWAEAVIPLLRVHLVSMTMGLLAVRVATHSEQGNSTEVRRRSGRVASWSQIRTICLASVAVHGLTWLILPRFTEASIAIYVAALVRGPANSMFVLWGYYWPECKGRWIFIGYTCFFALIEAISGSRGYYLFPIILFGIGLLASGAFPKMNMGIALKVIPVAIVLLWSFVKSEDVRTLFSRDQSKSTEEAIERITALADSSSADSIKFGDANGSAINAPFRIGSRLFETSAADVISRTPSWVPYYGWTADDWSVLLTGILPLRFNPGAAYFSSQNTGVFFLRSYGWFVDPFSELRDTSTSMPATLVGDAWRRFGWLGVIVWFFVWPWFLARASLQLRFRTGRFALQIFTAAFLVDISQCYTSDITYLISSLPRRLVVLGAYSLLMSLLAERERLSGPNSGEVPRTLVVTLVSRIPQNSDPQIAPPDCVPGLSDASV